MQRMKDEGRDISNPMFRNAVGSDAAVPTAMVAKQEVVMTKEGVNRKISMEEVKAHSSPEEPWFVVLGEGEFLNYKGEGGQGGGRRKRGGVGGRKSGNERAGADRSFRSLLRFTVYDGTGFLKDHPGGAESITLMAGEDATEDL